MQLSLPAGYPCSLFLFRNFLSFLARLGQADGDCLPSALHLSAFSAATTLGCAALVSAHFAFNVPAGAARISAFCCLGHDRSPYCAFPRGAAACAGPTF